MRIFRIWKEGETAWAVNERSGKSERGTVLEVRMRYAPERCADKDEMYDGILHLLMEDGTPQWTKTLYVFPDKEKLTMARSMKLVKGRREGDLFEYLPGIPEGYEAYRWYGPEKDCKGTPFGRGK